MNQPFDYDLFVIGAGSGGVRAARMAANYGAKVAIAEEYRYGGTCVVRGCVPKKFLVYASRFQGGFEDSIGFGWQHGELSFDWAKLIAAKNKETARLSSIYEKNLKLSGVETLEVRASLAGPQEITLHFPDGEKQVSAQVILIAVGGTPFLPAIPGIEHAITSNEALDLVELPKSIAVIGGGYIAVEFASIFNGLGAKTTLSYRGDKVLRGFDDDLRQGLTTALVNRGIDVRLNVSPAEINVAGDQYELQMTDESSILVDAVMFATGRVPKTGGIGLETAGIETGSKGEIRVDAYSQTSCPSVYAVGDVTDRVNLTPVAIREGAAFAETVFNDNRQAVDHTQIATAVFSEPEIGTVGLSQENALAEYGKIDVYKSQFNPMKNTISGRDEKTLMKLIVASDSDKIIGCHILGPDAGEIIQAVGIAVKMGATKADFDNTIALHPSAAEELVTMREKTSYSV